MSVASFPQTAVDFVALHSDHPSALAPAVKDMSAFDMGLIAASAIYHPTQTFATFMSAAYPTVSAEEMLPTEAHAAMHKKFDGFANGERKMDGAIYDFLKTHTFRPAVNPFAEGVEGAALEARSKLAAMDPNFFNFGESVRAAIQDEDFKHVQENHSSILPETLCRELGVNFEDMYQLRLSDFDGVAYPLTFTLAIDSSGPHKQTKYRMLDACVREVMKKRTERVVATTPVSAALARKFCEESGEMFRQKIRALIMDHAGMQDVAGRLIGTVTQFLNTSNPLYGATTSLNAISDAMIESRYEEEMREARETEEQARKLEMHHEHDMAAELEALGEDIGIPGEELVSATEREMRGLLGYGTEDTFVESAGEDMRAAAGGAGGSPVERFANQVLPCNGWNNTRKTLAYFAAAMTPYTGDMLGAFGLDADVRAKSRAFFMDSPAEAFASDRDYRKITNLVRACIAMEGPEFNRADVDDARSILYVNRLISSRLGVPVPESPVDMVIRFASLIGPNPTNKLKLALHDDPNVRVPQIQAIAKDHVESVREAISEDVCNGGTFEFDEGSKKLVTKMLASYTL